MKHRTTRDLRMFRRRAEILGCEQGIDIAKHFLPDEYDIVKWSGKYFLVGDELEKLDSLDLVDAHCRDVIAGVNTALRIVMGGYELRINTLKEFDEDGNQINSSAFGTAAITVDAILVAAPDDDSYSTGKQLLGQLLNKPVFRKACDFFVKGDPSALWNVWEIIREDLGPGNDGGFDGAAIDMGWIAPDDLRRFCQSVNSPEVFGEKARHARSEGMPSNPMSLSDARRFIKELLLDWADYLERI